MIKSNHVMESTVTEATSRSSSGESPASGLDLRKAQRKRQRELKQIFTTRAKAGGNRMRTIEPTLFVGVGGAGIQVGSRSKKLLQDQGTDNFTRFLAIDTDETAQAGAPGCPGFTDEEFVHVKTERVRNVVDNPKSHKRIVDRIGLDEPEQAVFHQRLATDLIAQAGQVRSFGCTAFMSEYIAIKLALRRAISNLNGIYSGLEKQIEAKNRFVVRRRMTIFVVFSNAGGTGSSMALPFMAMIRSLTKDMPIEVVAMMIMPSAFDAVMDGKPEEAARIRANAYATLLELDAAHSGFLLRNRISFGPDERDDAPVPAGLFNQLFTVGRIQADGRELDSPEAVYDAVALHLAAIIGTEISDRVEQEDINQTTLRGLSADPMTGKPRYLSTIGAQALALPVERIARHSGACQMKELIEQRVVGPTLSEKDVNSLVEAWKNQPLKGESIRVDSHDLESAFTRLTLPNPALIGRSLYQVVNGSERIYYRNGRFVQQVVRLQTQLKEVLLPDFESKQAEISNSLSTDLAASLNARIALIAKSHGWGAVKKFCQTLIEQLDVFAVELGRAAVDDQAAAKAATAKIKELLTPMMSLVRSWFTSKKRQERVADHVQALAAANVRYLSKQSAKRTVGTLANQAREHLKAAEQTLAAADRCLGLARAAYSDSRAEQRLTTGSRVELDVSTQTTDRRMYAVYRIDLTELLDQIRTSLNLSSSVALRKIVEDAGVFDKLTEKLEDYFLDRFDEVSIVDVLADQLDDPAEAPGALARINQAPLGTQPMWQAESGQNGVEFSDSMLVGVPESTSESKRAKVVSAIMEATSHRIHANGQYHGEVSHVVSGDVHRIYLIRRNHGACPHYLTEVVKAHGEYDRWMRGGGHSVHILNHQTVMKMSSLLAEREVDKGELAFALALPYAWVANRGPNWYWNLEPSEDDLTKRACRLASHWNGVAFQNMVRVDDEGAIDTLVRTGRLTYEAHDEPLPSQKIGQEMDEAFDCVRENGEMIELISETFDELRVAAGDSPVADELERYISSLRLRTRPGEANHGLILKMIELLTGQVKRLRIHAG